MKVIGVVWLWPLLWLAGCDWFCEHEDEASAAMPSAMADAAGSPAGPGPTTGSQPGDMSTTPSPGGTGQPAVGGPASPSMGGPAMPAGGAAGGMDGAAGAPAEPAPGPGTPPLTADAGLPLGDAGLAVPEGGYACPMEACEALPELPEEAAAAGFSLDACCTDMGQCGISMNDGPCDGIPDSNPECPELEVMGFSIPSCCTTDGRCGLSAETFTMEPCTSLEDGMAMFGLFIELPEPRACTP